MRLVDCEDVMFNCHTAGKCLVAKLNVALFVVRCSET